MSARIRFTNIALVVIVASALSLVAGCAREPDKKVASGQDHNLYKKGELLGQEQSAALTTDEATGFDLMTGTSVKGTEVNAKQSLFLQKLEQAAEKEYTFDISESYLTVNEMAGAAKQPVLKFEIADHFDMVREKDKEGRETQYLVKDTQKNPRWQDREYIEVDFAKPLPVKLDDESLKNLFAKADIMKESFKFGDAIPVIEMNPRLSDELANNEILTVKNGDVLTPKLTENYLYFYKGRQMVVRFAVEGHYDVKIEKTFKGEDTEKKKLDTASRPWQDREFVKINPFAPLKAVLSADFVTNSHKVVEKSVIENGCKPAADIVPASLKSALLEKGIIASETQTVCFEVSQSILTVDVIEGGERVLAGAVPITHAVIAGKVSEDRRDVSNVLGLDPAAEADWTKRTHIILETEKAEKKKLLVSPNILTRADLEGGEFIYYPTVVDVHSDETSFFIGSPALLPTRQVEV